MTSNGLANKIRTTWFGETLTDPSAIGARQAFWFAPDPARDRALADEWSDVVDDAAAGRLDRMGRHATGRLALILLLDQFPRNIYRGQPRCFARDGRARYLMRDGMSRLMDLELSPTERAFFYMPLQHSEFLEDQESSVARYEQLLREVDTALRPEFEGFLEFALQHRDIVARFGRFPHRNAILGRLDTPEEASFLAAGGESFGQRRARPAPA
jgi:uncharacterized protein (DUF924 family)